MLLIFTKTAWALPTGERVIQGDTVIHSQGQDMTITQQSQTTVLEFDQFSIAPDERVEFIQPDANSIAINHIVGGQASDIMGQLKANGHIFLLNTAGIMFGEQAQVDVGSLTATTLAADVNGWDPSNGVLHLKRTAASAQIINQGHIQAQPGGHILLLSPIIENQGHLIAQLGQIQLISADGANLQIDTQGLPGIQIQRAALDAWIDNQGTIEALGGLIELTAEAESSLWDTAINQSGLLVADSIDHQEGKIRLTSNASIDLQNQSLITANGGQIGNGGRVEVIADGATIFRRESRIEVRGGDLGGDGGFADTSGHGAIEIHGQVDTRALQGTTGDWLIDPIDVVIEDSDTNIDLISGTYTPNASGSTIDATTLANNLQFSNITVTTNVGSGSEAGDITVNSTIDLDNTNGNQLTLDAAGTILINANIEDSNTATDDATDLIFTSGNNFSMADGTTVNAGGGTIAVNAGGQALLSLLSTDNATTDAIRITAGGNIQDSGSTTLNLIADNPGAEVTLTSSAGNIQDLETQVHQLNLSAGNDRISIRQLIGDLLLGTTTLINSVEGINISTQDGALTLQSAMTLNGSGDLTLSVGDSNNSQDHDLAINAAITVDGDTAINLLNSTHDINLADAGDITLETGNLTMTTNGFIQMQADTEIISTSGLIELNGSTGIILGTLQTGSTANDAITLSSSQAGSIFDASEANQADIIASQGGLVFNDILSINNIEVDVAHISTSNNNVGNTTLTDLNSVRIADWDGSSGATLTLTATDDITVNNATIDNGTISLTSTNGSILDADNTSDTDIEAASVTLTAARNIGQLGSDTLNGTDHQLLQVDANQLSASLTTETSADNTRHIGIEHSSAQGAGALTLTALSTPNTSESASVWLTSQNNGLNLTGLTLSDGLDTQDTLVLIAADESNQNDDVISVSNIGALDQLRIEAHSLALSDSTVLTANDLLLQVGSSLNANIAANRFDGHIVSGSLMINSNTAGMQLVDLNSDGLSLLADHGNLTLNQLTGDLTIANTIQASDIVDDGVRAGLIDISVENGNLTIGDSGSATIQSINPVDQDVLGGLSEIADTGGPDTATSIRLRITDNSENVRAITIGNGIDASTISAQGGDIFIAAGANVSGTDEGLRELTLKAGSSITAFNAIADAADGNITLEEVTVEETATVTARTGRTLTLTSANLILANDIADSVNSVIQDITLDATTLLGLDSNDAFDNDSSAAQPLVPAQDEPSGQPLEKRNIQLALKRALPPCDPNNTQTGSYTCKSKAALEQFLNSLMLSDELPVIQQ